VRSYLRTALVFELAWGLLVVVASAIAHILVPDPEFVPFYFVVFDPIGYLGIVVFATPLTALTAIVLWRMGQRRGVVSRAQAVTIVVLGSLFVLGGIAAVAKPGETTLKQSAITASIAVAAFALLFPLPRRDASEHQ
jgi:hypothetical protein